MRVDVSGGTSTLAAGDTTAVAATDKIAYRDIVNLKAYAKDNYIRGLRGAGNDEVFHMFVTPKQMADLKLDSDFLANVRNAGVRGPANGLFAGTSSSRVDGVMIHEFRHVFSNEGATSGSSSNAGAAGYKWGAGADVEGARALFCGAQALAMADIAVTPRLLKIPSTTRTKPVSLLARSLAYASPSTTVTSAVASKTLA